MSLKTPLARVRGLGSAKDGTHHWWMQRLTALALVPLTAWFVAAMVCYSSADYQSAIEFVSAPVSTVAFLLLIGAVFYHAQLGVQVVVEDYVHAKSWKIASIVLLSFAHAAVAVAGVFSVLKIAFGANG